MLVGMPTHYHISCRVRASGEGIDAAVSEHADTIIEIENGTVWYAFCQWLLTEGSWLSAVFGWESGSDWETGDISIDESTHTLRCNGSALGSDYEFEIVVKPIDVSKQETAWDIDNADHTKPYDQARLLLELSERIFMITPVHRLRSIAAELSKQAVEDHLQLNHD